MWDVIGNDSPVTTLENLVDSSRKGQTAHFFEVHLVQPVMELVSMLFTRALTSISRILRGLRKAAIGGESKICESWGSEVMICICLLMMLLIWLKAGLYVTTKGTLVFLVFCL